MLIPILIVVQWLQMNYSQLERFSRAVLRHELNFEIEGECEGWTTLCIMQMIHLILITGMGLLWRSSFASNDKASLEFDVGLQSLCMRRSKHICVYNYNSDIKDIMWKTHTVFYGFHIPNINLFFFVLLHTFVQKPLHNRISTYLILSRLRESRHVAQGIASNASCPNGNLDPMRVVVGNLRIFPGRHRPWKINSWSRWICVIWG